MAKPILVRLFSDDADSVIWAPYAIDYADLGLDPELIEELQAWDAAYYAGLENYDWKDPATQAVHAAEGRRLARRLAGVLGDEFLIRIDGGEDFRSAAPGAVAGCRCCTPRDRPERGLLKGLRQEVRPWS